LPPDQQDLVFAEIERESQSVAAWAVAQAAHRVLNRWGLDLDEPTPP
jgi:hypothetical protein